jgi:hypothetical protein
MTKLDNDELKCDCGSWAKPAKLRLEGKEVRGWKCKKCDMEFIHPEDAQTILYLNKLKKQALEVKIGSLGSNQIIRFPKEVSTALRVHSGDTASIKVCDHDRLEIQIKHKK